MNKKVQHAVAVAVMAGTLAGCFSSGNRRLLDDQVVAQVRPGISTQEDVRRVLGEELTCGQDKDTVGHRGCRTVHVGRRLADDRRRVVHPVCGF